MGTIPMLASASYAFVKPNVATATFTLTALLQETKLLFIEYFYPTPYAPTNTLFLNLFLPQIL